MNFNIEIAFCLGSALVSNDKEANNDSHHKVHLTINLIGFYHVGENFVNSCTFLSIE